MVARNTAAAGDFTQRRHDQPEHAGPVRSYVIAGLRRSGSSLLADLLRRSGRMGVPAPYFDMGGPAAALALRLGVRQRDGGVDLGRYLDAVMRRRTTGNGVFGLYAQFDQIRAVLGDRAGRRFLRQSRFAWVRRRDALAHAIAFLRTFHGPTGPRREETPTFGAKDIDRVLGLIEGQDRAWRLLFDASGLTPLEIWLEDLVRDPDAVCRAVCALVGEVAVGPFLLERDPTAGERDRVGSHWRERYRASFKC